MRDFLAGHPPYSQFDALACRMTGRYLPRGSGFPPPDAARSSLYVLRKGAAQLRCADGIRISTIASAAS